MKSAPGARARLGYHDHYVVDGGKARIILAALVSPGSVMENALMLDLVRRVRLAGGSGPAGHRRHHLRHHR